MEQKRPKIDQIKVVHVYMYVCLFICVKSPSLGGIPHDTYGMTTRSVHQYVLGILNKLGLDESQIKKLQTGGPDGDLGSNEIKISKVCVKTKNEWNSINIEQSCKQKQTKKHTKLK